MSVVEWLRPRLNPGRFGRFALVGALGTGLDMGLLLLLTAAGLPTLPANVISYSAGIVNNYTWNRRWTFADRLAACGCQRVAMIAPASSYASSPNQYVVAPSSPPTENDSTAPGAEGTGSALAFEATSQLAPEIGSSR